MLSLKDHHGDDGDSDDGYYGDCGDDGDDDDDGDYGDVGGDGDGDILSKKVSDLVWKKFGMKKSIKFGIVQKSRDST